MIPIISNCLTCEEKFFSRFEKLKISNRIKRFFFFLLDLLIYEILWLYKFMTRVYRYIMQHRLFRRLQVSKSPTALLETKTRVEIRIRATGQMEMRASIDIRTCIRFITLIITTSFERLISAINLLNRSSSNR